MIRRILPSMLVLLFLGQSAVRSAETHDELLAQVQAADVLSDLLTWHCTRIKVRVGAMATYLKEIGKLDAYNQSPPSGDGVNTPFYDQVFAGAVQFVKSGGDQYADPALKKLTDIQLLQELTSLQSYDIQEFVYLNQKRQTAASARAYLNSINSFDDYLKWAQAHSPQTMATINATASSTLTPEQTVAWGERIVESARQAAWKRAKAKGMSHADFDRLWAEKREQFNSNVAKRVQSMSALAAALQQAPAPPLSAENPTPIAQPVNNWNTWNDSYPDGFASYNGGSFYRSYDTRVDLDNDTRVDGEYDRRVNLNYDRRENIQIDARQSV